MRILKTKKKRVTAAKKTGRLDFPEKRVMTKAKYLLPVHQIVRGFTKGNAPKIIVDVIKYRETLTFSFERAQTS